MDLEVLNNIMNNARENKAVTNFVKELSDYLENMEEEHNIMSIKEIEEDYKLTYDSACELKDKRNEILKEYACELKDKLYYVSYKNPDKDIYKVLEFNDEGESTSFYLSEETLPQNISVDKVIRKSSGKFEVDEETTKIIIDKVKESASQIAKEQEARLSGFREEEGLYQVVDFSRKGVFLKKTTNAKVFEETNISKEVLDKIGNDVILRYRGGEYIFEEELTDKFFSELN